MKSIVGGGIGVWYKKRFSRVIIPYLVAAIPFYVWFCIYNNYGIGRFIYHLSSLSFWVEHEGMWYVDLLIPLYLITPVFSILIERHPKARIVPTVILMCICFFVSILPIPDFLNGSPVYNIFSNIQIVIRRVPGYILGYYVGKHVMEKRKVSWLILPVCMAALFIFARIPIINRMYRGWLLGLSMMLVFCVIIRLLERTKIKELLKWLGKRSLELYLANCILVPVLFTFTYKFGNVDLSKGNYFYYVMVVIINFPLAELIYLVSNRIRGLLNE